MERFEFDQQYNDVFWKQLHGYGDSFAQTKWNFSGNESIFKINYNSAGFK